MLLGSSSQDISELEKIEEFYDMVEKKPKVSEHSHIYSSSFSAFHGSLNKFSEKNYMEHHDNDFNYLQPNKIFLNFKKSQKMLEEVNFYFFNFYFSLN
jgi:hypothetical protein